MGISWHIWHILRNYNVCDMIRYTSSNVSPTDINWDLIAYTFFTSHPSSWLNTVQPSNLPVQLPVLFVDMIQNVQQACFTQISLTARWFNYPPRLQLLMAVKIAAPKWHRLQSMTTPCGSGPHVRHVTTLCSGTGRPEWFESGRRHTYTLSSSNYHCIVVIKTLM